MSGLGAKYDMMKQAFTATVSRDQQTENCLVVGETVTDKRFGPVSRKRIRRRERIMI